MTTYAGLRNRILDELDRAGQLTSQAETAIQTAIRFYEGESFWFNETRATTDTVADQEWYGLPQNFVELVTLSITVNDYTYPLINISQREAESRFISSTEYTGQPTHYCIYDEQVRLHPIPDQAYTLTFSYLWRLQDLEDDTDTNAWTVEAQDLISARADREMALRLLHDRELAKDFEFMEREQYLRLKAESNLRLLTGASAKRTW